MDIPPSVIRDYLDEKFTESSVAGREFRTNSLFTEDTKQKLYINLDTGFWIDFKSSEKGNFYQLVSMVDNVPYRNARTYINKLAFDKGANLFEISSLNVDNVAIEAERTIAEDVKSFVEVTPTKDINSPSLLKRAAAKFAYSRGLQQFKFFVANYGKYHQRVIIPWEPKYLNPSKALYGIKTSEILYPYDESQDYVIVTEGPLDAMTLRAAGYNATCTQGCKMSTVQAKSLKPQKVIVAYDIYKLVPPKEFKDWNEFWVKGKESFCAYVEKNIAPASWESLVIERLT
jgi:hypothetical protein